MREACGAKNLASIHLFIHFQRGPEMFQSFLLGIYAEDGGKHGKFESWSRRRDVHLGGMSGVRTTSGSWHPISRFIGFLGIIAGHWGLALVSARLFAGGDEASWLYLPHAFQLIVLTWFGAWAIPAVVLAEVFSGLSGGFPFDRPDAGLVYASLNGAKLAAVALFLSDSRDSQRVRLLKAFGCIVVFAYLNAAFSQYYCACRQYIAAGDIGRLVCKWATGDLLGAAFWPAIGLLVSAAHGLNSMFPETEGFMVDSESIVECNQLAYSELLEMFPHATPALLEKALSVATKAYSRKRLKPRTKKESVRYLVKYAKWWIFLWGNRWR
jgi:hypothetical protein